MIPTSLITVVPSPSLRFSNLNSMIEENVVVNLAQQSYTNGVLIYYP